MHSPDDLGSHNLEFGSVDERSGALRTCQIKVIIFKGIKVSKYSSFNTFHEFIWNGILKILTSLMIAERFPSFLLYFPFVEQLFFHFAKAPPAELKMWIGPDLRILQPRYYFFWRSAWKACYTYKILLKNVFENSSCHLIHTTRLKDYNYIYW